MWYETASEFVTLALSSAGVAGAMISVIFGYFLKRAKSRADRHREERLKLDILRLEGEERLSELIYAIIRYSRGNGSTKELDNAEKAYSAYLESARRMKNEIISFHTIK